MERVDEERSAEFVLLGLSDHPSVRRTGGAEVRRQIFTDRRHRAERRPHGHHAGDRDLRRRGRDVRQPNGSGDGTSERDDNGDGTGGGGGGFSFFAILLVQYNIIIIIILLYCTVIVYYFSKSYGENICAI